MERLVQVMWCLLYLPYKHSGHHKDSSALSTVLLTSSIIKLWFLFFKEVSDRMISN